jgi:hypothetical protein
MYHVLRLVCFVVLCIYSFASHLEKSCNIVSTYYYTIIQFMHYLQTHADHTLIMRCMFVDFGDTKG